MARHKGVPIPLPPGTAAKISASLRAYYAENPRTDEHNARIGQSVSRTKQAKKKPGT